jgi:osmotically-inducible protein OsmY
VIAFVQADLANADLMPNINVSAADGVVTLTGSVPGAAQKSSLEKIAGGVDGVSSVKNKLEVK